MIHSTFSPAGMPADLLEKTFVQRERMAERLTQLFVESALTDSKHHVLLVGPRGIGKSHLVSLIYHRLLHKPELKDRLAIAYLREDEWGVTSFLDLLIRILREFNVSTHEFQNLNVEAAEDKAWRILRDTVQGKTLLVILENLENILWSMGEEEQRKWPACVQNNLIWSLLATTPSLSEDISNHAAPFYGFFEIQPLEGLSVEDAVTLMQRLSESQGRSDIADYVSSPAGWARVRAVQHLANGNHRVFVIFYDFLAHDKEADLVEPVLKTIDALTPYYQSQMKELSPQQRKLVEFLCRFRGAAKVKMIAAACFVSHQTAAAQLKQLLESRYLRVTRLGRESYYELNEPLLRICIEAKVHDGQPIRLLVEFLRYWFPRQELSEKVTVTQPDSIERAYLAAALREYETGEGHLHLSPEVGRLCVVLSHVADDGDERAIKVAAEELAEVSKIAEDWMHYGRALSWLGREAEAIGTILQNLKRGSRSPEALVALGKMYVRTAQSDLAMSAFSEAVALNPRCDFAFFEKGKLFEKLGKDEEALAAYSEAIQLGQNWSYFKLAKAKLLLNMNRYSEAGLLLKAILRPGQHDDDVYVTFGRYLIASRSIRRAKMYFSKATRLKPNNAEAWYFLARTIFDLGYPKDALATLKTLLHVVPEGQRTQHFYCKGLFAIREYHLALRELSPEVVAHQVFHELLDLFIRGGNKDEVGTTFLNLRSALADDPGTEALAGGLIEFTKYAQRHAEPRDVPQLRFWSEVISHVFSEDHRFEIVRRVFDVVVRYQESGDERVLLELPLEQRQLLQSKDAGASQTSKSKPQTSIQ